MPVFRQDQNCRPYQLCLKPQCFSFCVYKIWNCRWFSGHIMSLNWRPCFCCCHNRKEWATTWTYSSSPFVWVSALSWGCRGSWLPRSSPSTMSTAWGWSRSARRPVSAPRSSAAGKSIDQFCYVVSWEPEGCYHYTKMFRWEPEGRYHHRLCTAIAPFWFSTEHLWQ